MDEEARQVIVDAEHLKLLRWGYFVSAGFTAFFSLFGLAYVGMGALMSSLPFKKGDAPPEAFILMFIVVGILITVIGLAIAAAKLRVAKALRERNSRTLCYVVAVITMLGMPYGTALGILTMLVLSRPSVAKMFGAGPPATVAYPSEPAQEI
ncbi:MAG: hypothetical protein OEM15_00460 [Myxococcales bacterium]|nr:hypothetical protein [Myxococcales bacterium]MDH3485323.1 hypothetical protein [Myxococcales bacterium]